MPIIAKAAFFLLLSPCAIFIIRAMRNNNLRNAIIPAACVIPLSLSIWFGLVNPRVHDSKTYKEIVRYANQLIEPGQYGFTRKKSKPQYTIWGHYFLQGLSQPNGKKQLGLDPQKKYKTESLLRAFSASDKPQYLFIDSNRAKGYKERYGWLDLYKIKHFDVPEEREDGGLLIVTNQAGKQLARAKERAAGIQKLKEAKKSRFE